MSLHEDCYIYETFRNNFSPTLSTLAAAYYLKNIVALKYRVEEWSGDRRKGFTIDEKAEVGENRPFMR